jgi:hypothetical protein
MARTEQQRRADQSTDHRDCDSQHDPKGVHDGLLPVPGRDLPLPPSLRHAPRLDHRPWRHHGLLRCYRRIGLDRPRRAAARVARPISVGMMTLETIAYGLLLVGVIALLAWLSSRR